MNILFVPALWAKATPWGPPMRSIPDRATAILYAVLLADAQLRAAGVPAKARIAAHTPGVEAFLTRFQDELLDAQRDAGTALAAALNTLGGRP